MPEYHKIVCPHCKYEIINKAESSVFNPGTNHIECPKCHSKLSCTKPATIWDLIKSTFEL